MKKVILAVSMALVSSLFVSAQTADDYKKVEVYVGYSNGQIDTGIDSGNSAVDFFRERENFNGFNVSGVYNVSRYVGIKGDFSGTYNSKRFTGEVGGPSIVSFKNTNSLYNFLGGVQVKDNSKKGVFKPFGHVLVGAGHARAKFSDFSCTPSAACPPTFPVGTFSETGFAAAIGGGLDFRLNNRIQIRAIQVDYNPVRLGGETQNNLRIGAGIVF